MSDIHATSHEGAQAPRANYPQPHVSVARTLGNSVTLRPYQLQAVEDIRDCYRKGARRVLLQSPTGSGKTITFAFIGEQTTRRGKRVLYLAHRAEIVDQIGEALDRFGIPHGFIRAGEDETDAIAQVASVATLVRRLEQDRPPFDLIVIDEAHHAVASTWRQILEAYPDVPILGVTATPERLDGKGLADIFDALVLGPSVKTLTEKGYLKRTVVYAPPTRLDLSKIKVKAGDYNPKQLAELMMSGTLMGDAVDHYKRLCPGTPAICFCVTIEHSKLMVERFLEAGVRAAHVDGTTPSEERKDLIAALGKGEIDVLCNCALISEGVDVPIVGAVILLRPTKSLAMFLQQVGRALRPVEGQDAAIVLDHAGNTLTHGLPDEERVWSLDSKKRKRGPVYVEQDEETGEFCRREPPPELKIDLELYAAEQDTEIVDRMTYKQSIAWARRGPNPRERLKVIAKAKGYKRGWVHHTHTEMVAEASSGVRP